MEVAAGVPAWPGKSCSLIGKMSEVAYIAPTHGVRQELPRHNSATPALLRGRNGDDQSSPMTYRPSGLAS
jgi:hypothetical protein